MYELQRTDEVKETATGEKYKAEEIEKYEEAKTIGWFSWKIQRRNTVHKKGRHCTNQKTKNSEKITTLFFSNENFHFYVHKRRMKYKLFFKPV